MNLNKFKFLLKGKWLFFILLALSFEHCNHDPSESIENTVNGTPVKIIHPRIIDFTDYIDLNANTVFLKKEVVRATFQGFVVTVHKAIGEIVRKGDLIVTIQTKESAAEDSISLNPGTNMFRGAVKIVAHSNGVISALNYHSGDFVSEGEEIAAITNPSSLSITLNVPYAYVSKIGLNTLCRITLPDGKIVPAIVQNIIPSVDPASQTQTYLLAPQQSIHLPEDLNVNVRLPLQTVKNATVLPRSAILSNETQEKFWVMKVSDDSLAIQVGVQKGIENDSLIQIIHPAFDPNDKIISEGGFGLPDSSKVTVN